MARSRTPPPLLPQQNRYQQTRFQRRIAEALVPLTTWAGNPWRRFSLLTIVLLLGFVVGGGVASITGALSHLDPAAALLCVIGIETASRLRWRLLARSGDRLALQLLDMARMGVLYGLLLDGFKLL